MATMVYFFIGPTAILSAIGLLHGPDKTIPTPKEGWENAVVDVLIPAYNEQRTITLCLDALSKQSLKPRNITLIDDNSSDHTVEYVTKYCQIIGLNINIIQRNINMGKTPSIRHGAFESDADVEFVLDGDTVLESEDYIEKLVKELYQGVGIASACGVILTLRERDYARLLDKSPVLKQFQNENPETKFIWPPTWSHRLSQGIVHLYREILYLFLQKYIYRGEMAFFGSIINPVGCAVAYRRKYVQDVLEKFSNTLGLDLTTSEDIFIGFSFLSQGYRNIQVQGVVARTKEPSLARLPHQLFLWSSSFLQSCYYFNFILKTPFKAVDLFQKQRREKHDPEHQKALDRRKIKEAYRQAFGEEYTKRYGRPMGWYIFTSALEKVSFPTVLLIFMLWGSWNILLVTILAELFFFALTIAIISNSGERLLNAGKAILVTPLRYAVAIFDLAVIVNFTFDIWVRTNRKWRK